MALRVNTGRDERVAHELRLAALGAVPRAHARRGLVADRAPVALGVEDGVEARDSEDHTALVRGRLLVWVTAAATHHPEGAEAREADHRDLRPGHWRLRRRRRRAASPRAAGRARLGADSEAVFRGVGEQPAALSPSGRQARLALPRHGWRIAPRVGRQRRERDHRAVVLGRRREPLVCERVVVVVGRSAEPGTRHAVHSTRRARATALLCSAAGQFRYSDWRGPHSGSANAAIQHASGDNLLQPQGCNV
eukprot:scaffold58633_cov57-Phaeocystis_antarctica.AAC.2